MNQSTQTSITFVDDAAVMIVSDEVEAVAKTRVRLTMSFLYANLCIEEIYKSFNCEGCEKGWLSQKDHMCCHLDEEDIVEEGYENVFIDLDLLKELCEQFLKLADLPMTEEWVNFINNLPLSSPQGMLLFWKDVVASSDPEEETIVDFVRMITNVVVENAPFDQEPYAEFEHLMMH